MLTRRIAILRCFKYLVGGPSFRPSTRLGLLPQPTCRSFCSEGQTPASHISCRLRTNKAARSIHHALADTILESLRKSAAKRRSKCASAESWEREAICEALSALGLEKHTQEFVENQAALPYIQKVQLLMIEGVIHSDMKTLLSKRAFSVVSLDMLTAVLTLLKRFFVTGEVASKVLAQNAGILLKPIEHLEKNLKCLEDFEVGEMACLRIGTSTHRILTIRADNFETRLAFFQKMDLSREDTNGLLYKFPQVLKLSVENNLQPTIDFFESTGMNKVAMLKMLCRHPHLLGHSVDKNLAIKFDALKQLGFTSEKCCKAFGCLAQCSHQQLFRCYNALKSHFSIDDACLILQRQPKLISTSLKSIEVKLDYLVNVQNRDLQEIVRFPACLTCSLEKRIAPRFSILKEKNLAEKYSLSSILSTKTDLFKRWFRIPQSVIIS